MGDLKYFPLMVIGWPTGADCGENDSINGGEIKVKPGKLAESVAVKMVTFPFEPGPATAFMDTSLRMLNEITGTPPTVTLVTPDKLLPEMVSTIPALPSVG